MPKGDGQRGKRRGRYASPGALLEPAAPGWDDEHYDGLVEKSPLADDPIKRNAAERATELHCALREMHGRILNTEEQANRAKYSVAYRKWLEFLKLGQNIADDEEEL